MNLKLKFFLKTPSFELKSNIRFVYEKWHKIGIVFIAKIDYSDFSIMAI